MKKTIKQLSKDPPGACQISNLSAPIYIYIYICIYIYTAASHKFVVPKRTPPPRMTPDDTAWAIHGSPRVHIRQQTCLLCHTADMSAVGRSRHVCFVRKHTCLLCDTADRSAVSHSRHIWFTKTDCEHIAYRCFKSENGSSRGVRKVTTGITGLCQRSVHGDVAFWSFDVGSSYH